MATCLTYEELERVARSNLADRAEPSSRTVRHLATCRACRDALEEVRANLNMFDECIAWKLRAGSAP